MKKVYISIVDFHGKENTQECLDSLEKVKTHDFSLRVVIINTAENIPYSLHKKEYKNFSLEILDFHKNLGFAGGQNKGIQHALSRGANYVIVLNNDTVVKPDFVEQLIAVAQKENDIGIVSPKIYFAKGFEYHHDRYKKEELGKIIWYAGGIFDWKNVIGHHRGVDEVDNGQYDTISSVDFASGCCMLLKKEVIEKIGMFNEKYFLYYEDADLSERAKKNGFKNVYAPKSVIWHKNAGSVGGSGSGLQDYYIIRNRLFFAITYAPIRSKIAILKESLRLVKTGRPWQKKGVIDFYKGIIGIGSYR